MPVEWAVVRRSCQVLVVLLIVAVYQDQVVMRVSVVNAMVRRP